MSQQTITSQNLLLKQTTTPLSTSNRPRYYTNPKANELSVNTADIIYANIRDVAYVFSIITLAYIALYVLVITLSAIVGA